MNFKSFLAFVSLVSPSGFFQVAQASGFPSPHKTASATFLQVGDPSNSGSEVYKNYDFGKPLLDFRAATEQRWSFASRHQDVEISAASYVNPQAKGDVVFMTGVMDSFSRNLETIYDLYQQGYSVYTFDHRGQGLSSRLAPNPQVVHVQSFSDYSDDFSDFMNIIRPDIMSERAAGEPKRDLFLVTVSMGALVGAKYIVAHPHVFNAVSYGAPMFKISLQNFFGRLVARPLLEQMCRMGRCDKYVPGGSDYKPGKYTVEENPLYKRSHSIRFFGSVY